jgi:hypothetical protein
MANEFVIKNGFISKGKSIVEDDLIISGSTLINVLSASTINIPTTPVNNNFSTEILVRNSSTGLVEYRDITSLSDIYTTGTTFNGNILEFNRNDIPNAYNVDLSDKLRGSFGITIDGGGSSLTIGEKGYLIVPYNGTITGWSLIADQPGDCVIDVWKTSGGTIPTVSDTITGTEKPTLSSQQINSDLTLTSWTTGVNVGDVVAFNIDSVSTITRVNLSIYITKQ